MGTAALKNTNRAKEHQAEMLNGIKNALGEPVPESSIPMHLICSKLNCSNAAVYLCSVFATPPQALPAEIFKISGIFISEKYNYSGDPDFQLHLLAQQKSHYFCGGKGEGSAIAAERSARLAHSETAKQNLGKG